MSMFNKLLNELSYEDLDEDQHELVDCIGLEGYKRFVSAYGGGYFYVQIPSNICRNARNRKICKEFDGGNYRQLAKKYDISVITVRRIINAAYKNKH